jgi:hypothetical protein
MSSVTFQTTGNEARLLTVIFPVDYEVTKLNWRDIGNMPRFVDYRIGTNQIVHEAIRYSTRIVVKPEGFRRNLDKKDKGTPDSANWPNADTRKCINISDAEEELLQKTMRYFDGDRTKAIIWMLYNYNRLVSMNPDLLDKTKKAGIREKDGTKVMTIRLPKRITDYAETQAKAFGMTAGGWLRETIIPLIDDMMAGAKYQPVTETTTGDEATTETEDFDFDLEAE